MYEIMLVLRQDMKLLFTNSMWIFYHTLFPLLLIYIMGNLSSSLYGTKVTAYDFYGVTFLIYSAINTATIASNSFMEERIKQGNMRILYAPINHHWLYISKIIASAIFTYVLHMIVAFFLVILFNVQLGNHILALMGLLFLTEVCSSTLGVLLCLLFHSEAMANQLLSIVINLSAVFGGVFFSMERFGTLLQQISWLSPMKWLLHASFACIYDGAVEQVYMSMVVLVIATFVLLCICKRIFQEERCLC